MKKKYSSPDIAFESFSLSTSIAGNCEFKTHTPAAETCGYFLEGVGMVFIADIQACVVPISDELSYIFNGFCYHVPVENSTLFNS